jgi:hypothetical protein
VDRRGVLQVTFAITPDIQVVVDPALNPDQEVIGFFGLRARFVF